MAASPIRTKWVTLEVEVSYVGETPPTRSDVATVVASLTVGAARFLDDETGHLIEVKQIGEARA